VYQLWVRRLAETELFPLPGTNLARVPFWSADSRSIGFFADGTLKTVSATGGPARVLCDAGGGTGYGGTWSSDGTILYAPSDRGGIFRVAASGGACLPVTTPEMDTVHVFPEFLPDGRHFFYVVTRGDESRRGVYMAALDDPNGTRVIEDVSSVNYVAPQNGNGRQSCLRSVLEGCRKRR
jgi:eukaryotic-like serine/threonine-protein kinase